MREVGVCRVWEVLMRGMGLLLVAAATTTPMRMPTPISTQKTPPPTPTPTHPQACHSPFLVDLAPPRIEDHPQVCPLRRVCIHLGIVAVIS